MNDVILFGQPIANWAVPAATFVFGLACGWLGWSGRNRRDGDEEGADAPVKIMATSRNAETEAMADTTEPSDAAERTGDMDETEAPVRASEDHAKQDAASTERPSVDPVQLQALELELRKAREALEAAEYTDAGLAEEIKALDDAVNRANGRLKIVARSVRKIINKS